MSIPILNELYADLKRLTIAGSDLATGDMSLKKKLPVLTKMGERAPVFTRLASLTEKLVNGVDSTSKNLMEASQLLSSVISTMGKTGVEGELINENIKMTLPTDLSFLTLKPIVEALTSKGSGRLEVIKEANQSTKIFDLRLVLPLIYALDDSYPEISDYVAEEILPKYSVEIVPFLLSTFSIKGKKGDGRIVKIVSTLIGENGLDFYFTCVENGSQQVKLAALEVLAQYDEGEEILLESIKAKSTEMKKTAYKGLMNRESSQAAEAIGSALGGKDRDLILELASEGSSAIVQNQLLNFAQTLYALFHNARSKENQELLLKSLYCLREKNMDVSHFLKKLIADPDIPAEVARVAAITQFTDERESLEYTESIIRMPGRSSLADLSLLASLLFRSEKEIYDIYSRYAKRTRKDPAGSVILEMMDRIIFFREDLREYDEQYRKHTYRYHSYDLEFDENYFIGRDWDKRWVDLLISIDEENLVYRLPNKVIGKNHLDYLLKKLSLNPYFSSNRGMAVMTSLVQINYEPIFEVMVDILKKTDVNMKSVKFHTSAILDNLGLFCRLAKTYADELELVALQDIEHERLKERLLEMVYEMRHKGEE